MVAKSLINYLIPPVKINDTIEKTLSWMNQFRVHSLPLVVDHKFLGFISEENILNSEVDKLETLDKITPFATDCLVHENEHFYEILKIASSENNNLVAVLDQKQNYLGVVSIDDAINMLGSMSSVQSHGAILVLKMRSIDYSLSQISRLIEENNAKITSLTLNNDEIDPNQVKLTLKINTQDLKHIIATLERFGYEVVASFQTETDEDEVSERYDLLMKFLNI